jgi:Zinc finger, C3HC4 type (RING finger)
MQQVEAVRQWMNPFQPNPLRRECVVPRANPFAAQQHLEEVALEEWANPLHVNNIRRVGGAVCANPLAGVPQHVVAQARFNPLRANPFAARGPVGVMRRRSVSPGVRRRSRGRSPVSHGHRAREDMRPAVAGAAGGAAEAFGWPIRPGSTVEKVRKMKPDVVKRLKAQFRSSEDDCAVCMESVDNTLILTECGHTICGKCLEQLLAQRDPKCPHCRGYLHRWNVADKKSFLEVYPAEGDGQ